MPLDSEEGPPPLTQFRYHSLFKERRLAPLSTQLPDHSHLSVPGGHQRAGKPPSVRWRRGKSGCSAGPTQGQGWTQDSQTSSSSGPSAPFYSWKLDPLRVEVSGDIVDFVMPLVSSAAPFIDVACMLCKLCIYRE